MRSYSTKKTPEFCVNCPNKTGESCHLVLYVVRRVPGSGKRTEKTREDFLDQYQQMFDNGDVATVRQRCAEANY